MRIGALRASRCTRIGLGHSDDITIGVFDIGEPAHTRNGRLLNSDRAAYRGGSTQRLVHGGDLDGAHETFHRLPFSRRRATPGQESAVNTGSFAGPSFNEPVRVGSFIKRDENLRFRGLDLKVR
jgi:hypothetical protein